MILIIFRLGYGEANVDVSSHFPGCLSFVCTLFTEIVVNHCSISHSCQLFALISSSILALTLV